MVANFLSAVLLLLALAVPAWANPCALSEDGMGGTGIGTGMGGTGRTAHGTGMGGTGNTDQGSGIGGTGNPALGGGIGGTGRMAKGSGMGGTGSPAQGSGMGGTGSPAQGSGIGGTGAVVDGSGIGGTGVVGVITGFGSICVNGLEIHYDGNTPVSIDGQAGSSGQLAVGQLVAVQAVGDAPSLHAKRIDLNSAVAGPVSWVAPGGQSFSVLGQSVHVGIGGRAPKVGEFVRVHGFRGPDGTIEATHVEHLPVASQVSLSGIVAAASGKTARIGGLTAVGVSELPVGASVRLSGRLGEGGVLEAKRADLSPEMHYAGKSGRMVLQGIVNKADAKGISLGYARVEADAEAVRNVKPGQWVRVEVARRPDGRLDVQRMHLDRPRGGRDVAEPRSSSREKERGHRESAGGHEDGAGRDDDDRAGSGVRDKSERQDGNGDFEKVREDDKSERSEKVEKTEKAETVDRSEKAEKVEKVDKVEKTEKVEKVERVERAEKVEAPERVEKPDKVERDDD